MLVHAVISVEDKRFFQHVGFDPIGIIRAAYVDVKDRRNAQGASTLSQQLARGMFLKPEKNFQRKLEELMITLVSGAEALEERDLRVLLQPDRSGA